MAPTICPEKKNQIRPGVKKIRRHSHSSQGALTPSSPSTILKCYATANTSRSLRLRSSSTSYQNYSPDGILRLVDKNIYQVLPQVMMGSSIDNESDAASLQSTYEFSAPSPSSCCIDERLSPYSFYHDDDNFNSIDSEFNQTSSYMTSSFKNTISNDDSNVASLYPMLFDDNCQMQMRSDTSSCCDYLSQNLPFSLSQLSEVKNSTGLFDIAIKTINLVKRNQMLQQRLAQLQHETSEFIQSVLANPENRAFRENIQRKGGAEAI